MDRRMARNRCSGFCGTKSTLKKIFFFLSLPRDDKIANPSAGWDFPSSPASK